MMDLLQWLWLAALTAAVLAARWRSAAHLPPVEEVSRDLVPPDALQARVQRLRDRHTELADLLTRMHSTDADERVSAAKELIRQRAAKGHE